MMHSQPSPWQHFSIRFAHSFSPRPVQKTTMLYVFFWPDNEYMRLKELHKNIAKRKYRTRKPVRSFFDIDAAAILEY